MSISKDFDIIKNITQKYKNHPSIKSLKRNSSKGISYFSFQPISADEVIKVLKNIKDSKAVGGDIPTKILKKCEFTFDIITACINKAVETENFTDSRKMANVTPVFKNEDPLDKSNYKPLSILLLLSKVYERVINNQLSEYSNNFLNEDLCGFREAHSTQHAFFNHGYRIFRLWRFCRNNTNGFVESL